MKFLSVKIKAPGAGRPFTRLPGGILIHGNRIWFSETVSIALVALIVLFLLLAMGRIVINESRIGRYEETIAAVTAANLLLVEQIKEVKKKREIISVLQTMAGDRLSAATMQLLAELIYKNSTTFGYDPLLVLAVIHVESFFDARAQGAYQSGAPSGAFGLMQLKIKTAQDMADYLGMGTISQKDLLMPQINLALGIAYLTRLIAKFKSFKLGLLAYNQGPEIIRQQLAGAIPMSSGYYSRVLKSYYQIRKMVR
ncbi:MAG: transglycosylase SLT domain-containing protein [Chitinivibrionales bacterium]|nr:transglycosylase SLT domain-containing protein [Chitinivibrionales bacterium]